MELRPPLAYTKMSTRTVTSQFVRVFLIVSVNLSGMNHIVSPPSSPAGLAKVEEAQLPRYAAGFDDAAFADERGDDSSR